MLRQLTFVCIMGFAAASFSLGYSGTASADADTDGSSSGLLNSLLGLDISGIRNLLGIRGISETELNRRLMNLLNAGLDRHDASIARTKAKINKLLRKAKMLTRNTLAQLGTALNNLRQIIEGSPQQIVDQLASKLKVVLDKAKQLVEISLNLVDALKAIVKALNSRGQQTSDAAVKLIAKIKSILMIKLDNALTQLQTTKNFLENILDVLNKKAETASGAAKGVITDVITSTQNKVADIDSKILEIKGQTFEFLKLTIANKLTSVSEKLSAIDVQIKAAKDSGSNNVEELINKKKQLINTSIEKLTALKGKLEKLLANTTGALADLIKELLKKLTEFISGLKVTVSVDVSTK